MLLLVQKREQGGEFLDFNYSKLRGRIREIFGTQERFADALGIGRVTISQRLNNQSEFTQQEILKAANLLEIPSDAIPLYFFCEKVQKHEQRGI